MLVEISTWLKSNRNYLAGIALYEQYGNNNVLKDLFRQKQNPWLVNKLSRELQSILDTAEAIRPAVREVVKEKEAVQLPKTESEIIIKGLQKKKGELFREASSLHAHLHHMNQTEAAKAAPVILANFAEINRIWQILDNFDATGTLPANLTGRLTLREFVNRLKNLPTYITKLHKKTDDLPEGEEKNKFSLQLASYEAELDRLTQIMEKDDIIIQC